MPYRKVVYCYKGFLYRPWDDVEPDNIKTWHSVYSENPWQEVGDIPISPYDIASEECFRAWIDSGRPTRERVNEVIRGDNFSNPSQQDIITYYIEYILVK